MKVVINARFGGFALSEVAKNKLLALGVNLKDCDSNSFRCDPRLVQVVEQLGKQASDYESFEVIDIPFDSIWGWRIEESEGKEWIAEDHRTWRGSEDS